MSYLPAQLIVKGGVARTRVTDDDLTVAVKALLIQMKIMNEHLEIVTDGNLNEQDIDKGDI